MKTTNKGFRKFENGELVETSAHSVFGNRLTTGTVSVPVPDVLGVRALLTPGDHAKLLDDPALMDQIVDKARAAFAAPSTKTAKTADKDK